MKQILLIAGLVSLATLTFLTIGNDQQDLSFETWKALHNKKYNKIEELYRSKIYFENKAKIIAHNNDKSQTYTLGENQFSDLTNEEFMSTYLTAKIPDNQSDIPEYSSDNALGEADWSSVVKVKDQGGCGSCWAFSVVGATEAWFKIKKGVTVDLSEQQLLDCDSAELGCDGGYNIYALQYVAKNGLVLGSQYPYTQVKGTCKSATGPYKTNGTQNVAKNAKSLQSAINEYPVSVMVDATNWSQYSSGVFNNCAANINHVVVGVGYQADGVWIIKNSWGTGWGEKGFIRLAAGNTCGVLNQSYRPI